MIKNKTEQVVFEILEILMFLRNNLRNDGLGAFSNVSHFH